MKEKIIEAVYNKLINTYKVNFIPLEKFEQDFKIVSQDFLHKIKPIEKEYNRIKKSKDAPKIMVSKEDYIRDRFDMNPVLLCYPRLPLLSSSKHPKDKRRTNISFTGAEFEEYVRGELKKYTDEQLKEHFEESYKKFENEYHESIKKREEFMFNPLMHYAQKEVPDLFKINGFKQNGIPQNIETVEQLFKEHVSRLAIPTYRILASTRNNKLIRLDTPENILKEFRLKYLDDNSKYQQLYRNAEREIAKQQADFFITDYEINIGNVSFHTDRGQLRNTFEIIRDSKPPYKYIEKNDCEEVKSDIINVFLLTRKGDLIKLCIYDKGCLDDTSYFINKQIQKVNRIHNSVIKASPHKHFDPVIIVFDSPESASKFKAKIDTFLKGDRK